MERNQAAEEDRQQQRPMIPEAYHRQLPQPLAQAVLPGPAPVYFQPPFPPAAQLLLLIPHFPIQVNYNPIQDLLQLANQANQAGDLVSAECYCVRAYSLDPSNAQAILLLSTIHLQNGKLEQCHFFSRLALTSPIQNPDLTEGFFNLANLFKERGMLSDALRNYRHALYLNPNFVECYINMGRVFEELGDKDDAISAYRSALTLNPGLHQLRIELGKVYRSMGRASDACDCFLTVVYHHHNPEVGQAWCNLGTLYIEERQLWLALHCLEKATIYQPDLFDAHVNLAHAFKSARLLDNARTSYHRAMDINPNDPDVFSSLAEIYHEEDELDAAIRWYERAIQFQSKTMPSVYCKLADCYLRQKLVRDAEQCFREAIKLCPTYPGALEGLKKLRHEMQVEE